MKSWKAKFKKSDTSEWSKYGDRLLQAVEQGDAEKVALLLSKKGISATRPDGEGRTALHLAVTRGSSDCLDVMLCHGADVGLLDPSGLSVLHLAAKYGHTQCVRKLIQHKYPVEAVDPSGLTALHHAAISGIIPCVQFLCDQKAFVDARDLEGHTALALAGRLGRVEVCKHLLERGADVNAFNKELKTVLMLACEGGHLATVELLLKHGAEPMAVDSVGHSALHYACRSGNPTMLTLVQSATRMSSHAAEIEEVIERNKVLEKTNEALTESLDKMQTKQLTMTRRIQELECLLEESRHEAAKWTPHGSPVESTEWGEHGLTGDLSLSWHEMEQETMTCDSNYKAVQESDLKTQHNIETEEGKIMTVGVQKNRSDMDQESPDTFDISEANIQSSFSTCQLPYPSNMHGIACQSVDETSENITFGNSIKGQRTNGSGLSNPVHVADSTNQECLFETGEQNKEDNSITNFPGFLNRAESLVPKEDAPVDKNINLLSHETKFAEAVAKVNTEHISDIHTVKRQDSRASQLQLCPEEKSPNRKINGGTKGHKGGDLLSEDMAKGVDCHSTDVAIETNEMCVPGTKTDKLSSYSSEVGDVHCMTKGRNEIEMVSSVEYCNMKASFDVELKTLTKKLTILADEHSKVNIELSQIKCSHLKAQQEKKGLQAQVLSLEKEKTRLLQHHSEAQKTTQELNKTKHEHQRVLQSKETMIEDLQKEVGKLRLALNSLSKLAYTSSGSKRAGQQAESLQQQLKLTQQQLAAAERHHKDVVSVYRMHLLSAVQGQMDVEVQEALRQILKMHRIHKSDSS
ncbi:ankycorbin-like isoform X1 [Lethenteron reissneri]|uniref:ankycorbin-like isoform X1 n=1 Tax=Lethenteron reissneri TaxID=7753 RepID=UPI002AB7A13C|nr:ankycorbin-like isoform X1 [Lethenteron reissneri]XP_061409563.1 ankycorbin-like isoform X1 [Lethenteron reissneri]XP_061409564.1 ankycorbin-like isoform X1 [Lethenteron reissneri]XP_061409565.1 ankycorbin-like isoform X1 [Lethenteron reissneri]